VERETRGLVKLVAGAGTGRLLGVHVVAVHAGEIITAAAYALSAGMSVAQLADTWHPYLTMAEALKLAAQSYTRDVARLSCCAA
jgi:mercuric reductase